MSKHAFRKLAAAFCLSSLCVLGIADAAGPHAARDDAASLAPAERGELARRFVLKWGGYVERVYQVPTTDWAKRMVSTFVAADPSNFRMALRRDTFEGAVAQLTGSGHRLSDDLVIERYARAAMAKSADRIGDRRFDPRGATKVLGSTTGDLVFTPVTPCRIVDRNHSRRSESSRPTGHNTTGHNSVRFSPASSRHDSVSRYHGDAGPAGINGSRQPARDRTLFCGSGGNTVLWQSRTQPAGRNRRTAGAAESSAGSPCPATAGRCL